jgi:precorrin-6B methylase 2
MSTPDIHDLIQHSYAANALYVLTKHGIFDRLVGHRKSAQEVAEECGMSAAALEGLLSLAANFGFLKAQDGRFSTTRSGLMLTKQAKSWLRSYLMVWGEQLNPAFLHLDDFVKTGANAFTAAMGSPLWEFYSKDKAQSEIFFDHMAHVTDQMHIPTIVKDLRVANGALVVDVGGGTGSLICSLVEAHPDIRGIVCDQPSNRTAAEMRIDALGLQERCSFVGGNIFSSLPNEADLYLIKHVLHDWNDENATAILASISRAMDQKAELVIIEGLMDRDTSGIDPLFLNTRNIEQQVWTQGRVRNSSDFARLCDTAGLEVSEIVHSSIYDLSYLYCKKRA